METAYGTCVETRDANGDVIADDVATNGNHVLCHWFYIRGGSTLTAYTSRDGGWGETRFLTAAEWGHNGDAIIGGYIKWAGYAIDS